MGDQAVWTRVVARIERQRNAGTAAPGFRRNPGYKDGAPCNNNEICNDPVVLAVPPEPLPGAGPLVPLDISTKDQGQIRTRECTGSKCAIPRRAFNHEGIAAGRLQTTTILQAAASRSRRDHGGASATASGKAEPLSESIECATKGWSAVRIKKPIPGRPGIGAQLRSFNFPIARIGDTSQAISCIEDHDGKDYSETRRAG
jgi:hypothetical protein